MCAGVASSHTTGESTMVIVSSRPVINGTLSQEGRVGCYHGDTHIKCVGASKLLLFRVISYQVQVSCDDVLDLHVSRVVC